jgi:uncharacterized protein (TIRG00374 family)
MKKRFLISLAIGGLCLWLAFRQVEWGKIAEALRGADYRWIPVFILCHVVGMIIRTVRWRLILAPVAPAGFRSLLSALSIGLMANFIFPARAGEVIRAYLIGHRERVSKSAAFATIVLERLFDGFAILLFLALFPLFMTVPAGKEEIMRGITVAGSGAMVAYVVLMILLVALLHRREAFARFTARVTRPLPPKAAASVNGLIESFGRGLGMLGNPGHVIGVTAWSIALWVVMGIGNVAMFRAFSLDLPVFAGMFLVVFQSFGVMVPSPGYVGALQYAHVVGLSLFGVDKATALSLAILLHGLLFAIYIGFGLFFLWLEGMGLGEVREKGAGGEA